MNSRFCYQQCQNRDILYELYCNQEKHTIWNEKKSYFWHADIAKDNKYNNKFQVAYNLVFHKTIFGMEKNDLVVVWEEDL